MVVVVVLVIVLVSAGSNGPKGQQGPLRFAAPQSVVDGVGTAWSSDASAVGVSTSLTQAPTVQKGQPPLREPGSSLPTVAFVGAEFCPYCAAERWAIVMALSQFGHFSFLNETTSSIRDVDPQTVTFSFYQQQYASSIINWSPTEETTNRPNSAGTAYQLLETPPSWVATVYQKYDNSAGYPFLDIGNKFFVKSPSYNPAILAGMQDTQIVAQLENPSSTVAQAIVGTANYIVAGICNITGNQPTSVCSNPGVAKAAAAMGVAA